MGGVPADSIQHVAIDAKISNNDKMFAPYSEFSKNIILHTPLPML